MIIDNKLNSFLGRFSKIPAAMILIAGCLGIKHIWPVIFILLGLFILFTISGTQIDTEKMQVYLYNKLFGIFKVGERKSLENYKGLLIVPVRRYNRLFFMPNMITTIEDNWFGIYLIDKNNKPAIPLKRCKTLDDAHRRIDEFSLWLKLPVFTIRKNKELGD
jgi:hypothetical protein